MFRHIEDARVWLLFEPLDRLYGFFDRTEDAAGIVLHSGHPLSLQRFTAAHELGHYVLGHGRAADKDDDIVGRATSREEVEAQAFAAEFLMPVPLVNRAVERLGIEPSRRLHASDAYQLSLEMGSSYRATISRLEQLNMLSRTNAAELRHTRPLDLKIEMAGKDTAGLRRNDTWTLDERNRHRHPEPRVGDEVHVRLGELPSSGYRWIASGTELSDSLEQIADELEPVIPATPEFGAQRVHHLGWRCTAPTVGILMLTLCGPWGEQKTIEQINVMIRVHGPRTGDAPGGTSQRQRGPMIRAVA
ncbi:MAG: ImmA/IrrE family metallo-endopeptidase [Pseudonocardiaceae bacterium]